MARNYKREYDLYHGKPQQIKDRALRVKARRIAEEENRVHKGDGKDVHHKGSLKDARNTKVVPSRSNRSFPRKGEKGHGKRGR